NKIEVGVVMATDPPPGGMLSEGSHIEVQVSAGPRYQKVRMPDVRGMSVEAAQSRLSSLGLRVRVEESCEGGSTVVETHPIPGTMLKENDLVALFVC
ncbi:MAG TPA: PASTA domain-containing protein, partial [Actinomycetota bacterium]|nr:PASTA domain-containing protein [Actinomycetota bacterium]